MKKSKSVTTNYGIKYWVCDGQIHREDGPGIEYINTGTKSWYLNGENYSEEEYKKKLRLIKLEKIL